MWETFLTQQLAGKVAGGSSGGAGGLVPQKSSSLTATARSDIGAQEFTFGNVTIGARDKLNPFIVGGLALAALVVVALVVRR